MSREPPHHDAAPGPPALILVRNPVSHDARILREAQTLRALGLEVLIAGVVSTRERERRLQIGGFPVLRLDPGVTLRRALGQRGRSGAAGAPPAPPPSPSPGGGRLRPGRARLRRVVLTGSYYLQGARLVAQLRPAVVHANDYNTMWIAVFARLWCRSRVIYDSHELWSERNGRPEWRGWLIACEALFVRIADAVITASPGYASAMARRYRVPPPTVVRNIPPRAAGSSIETAPPPPAEPLIAYVGGLMPGRGLETAIRAVAQLPHARLRLVGPGNPDYVEALRRCAQQSGAGERVEFRAPVAPAELSAAIADASAGLMLIEPVCLSYELTLPNKLFEYAAAGLPVLASDLTVIGPLVRGEGLGEVVAVDDVDAIARGIERLGDPEHAARLRERVGEFAARETWEREQEVLAGVYRRALGAGGAAAASAGVEQAYAAYGADPRRQRRWSAANPGNQAIRDELVRATFELAGPALSGAGAILDLGCGTGWWLERLSRDLTITAELHGVDLLQARVAAAAARVPTARIVAADAARLPYEDGRFDVVSLFTVLSSAGAEPEVAAVLGEVRRVLAPDGTVLIWEPRLPNPRNRNTRLVTVAQVRELLDGFTLQTRTLTLLPGLARRLGPLTARAYPALARMPALRSHRLIVARRAGRRLSP